MRICQLQCLQIQIYHGPLSSTKFKEEYQMDGSTIAISKRSNCSSVDHRQSLHKKYEHRTKTSKQEETLLRKKDLDLK